jgi:hypothetical protein
MRDAIFVIYAVDYSVIIVRITSELRVSVKALYIQCQPALRFSWLSTSPYIAATCSSWITRLNTGSILLSQTLYRIVMLSGANHSPEDATLTV